MFQMKTAWRQDLPCLLVCIFCACVTYGMSVDFSRLRKPYLLPKRADFLPKRGDSSNPCPPESPFLCRSPKQICIALGNICDRQPDCPDGFDEDPQMCTARNRPSKEELENFLLRNEDWILPKLFNGASAEIVAHALVVSPNLRELGEIVGLGDKEDNLRRAFLAVREGDERPLLKMGMPEEEWYDVQDYLNRVIEGGLVVS
ncbi:neuropeptide prohormone-4-like isoform X1 [Saccostrea echinata]|uniref:neuropeptide prohormone-4-like isoform X1 n=2 Tax=Saccostrea echinata TaxID=191078 RepID=UPI002A819E0A|nr:neuropeptide prohormone-4-like isoform X1 [Saccostrea echinata]